MTSPALVGGREEDVVGRHGRSDRSGGFSLLEALFVVAILGILLALAFPTYQRVVMERRVQNTTREIAGLLRAAQQLAVAKSGDEKCAVVKFENNEVTVRTVAWTRTGCSTQDSNSQQLLASGYTARDEGTGQEWKPVRLGVTVTVSPLPSPPPSPQPSPTPALSFLPSGEASPAPFAVTVRGGGHERYVCVNAAGLVSVPPPGGRCP